MAEASILLRPHLSLAIERAFISGRPEWQAAISCQGGNACKAGFAKRSQAFAWAERQAERFDAKAASA